MSYHYVFFLGSHPELSAVEAYRVLSAQNYTPEIQASTRELLLLSLERALPISFLQHLGGTERIAKILAIQPTPWTGEEIAALVLSSKQPSPTKLTLGFSAVDMPRNFSKDLGRDIKPIFKEHGIRLRFVLPQKGTRLNSAQVIFNELTTPPNRELTTTKIANTYYVAETIAVQDITAYEVRDTQRPARDARVGMLPPKLAQIMLNLATSPLQVTDYKLPVTILDPFCGMGTVLQEGWIAGHTMHGTDINADMVAASAKNLDWVAAHAPIPTGVPRPATSLHDVRQPFPRQWRDQFDAVVTEPYLGKPLTTPLPARGAEKHIEPLADLYLAFFRNMTSPLKAGGYILLLLPAFRRGFHRDARFTLLPQKFLDAVKQEGYSLEQLIPPELAQFFPSNDRGTLLYSRPDALVGREFTLWKKR